MKVKEALDELFKDVKFDTNLHKKIVSTNINFITSSTEHKEMFGSRLIGCYYMSYTKFHKNIFYESLFDMDVEEVISGINKIKTIPKGFKIARDDINLTCFYIAHRFLSSPDLSDKNKMAAASAILDYFSFRTLVLLSSNYWIYPISEEKAVSLSERLSNKYIIKKVKNWNEYCQYRSEEYLKSKFIKLLVDFRDDKELPNAISDLFNRTKETLKNIYREFLDMMEDGDHMKGSVNVVTDIDGREVLMDRTEDPSMYANKIENFLMDKHGFIKRDYIEVVTNTVDSVSAKQMEEGLGIMFDYYFLNRKTTDEVRAFINGFMEVSLEYLQTNKISFTGKGNVVKIINSVVGNLLYTRGSDSNITVFKEQADKLVKNMTKKYKYSIGDRASRGLRNGLCVYILLLALL